MPQPTLLLASFPRIGFSQASVPYIPIKNCCYPRTGAFYIVLVTANASEGYVSLEFSST